MKSTVPLFYETYVSLKTAGARFPTSTDPAPPIFTPARSVSVELSETSAGGDPFSKLRNDIEEVKRKIALLESVFQCLIQNVLYIRFAL
jgi:hypothetical protein